MSGSANAAEAQGSWAVVDEATTTLTREYTFDGGDAGCFITKLADGKLLVISPPRGLSDADFAALDAFGEVGAVVAPNGFHHLGLPEFKKRYPSARFFAPPKAQIRIAKKNADAPKLEDISGLMPLLAEGTVIHNIPNTKCGEVWGYVQTERGAVWYGSDILANMRGLPSNFIFKQIFKWTKSGPGYSVFGLAMKFIVGNKGPVLRQMLETLKTAPPVAVIPGHGPWLEGDDLPQRTKTLLESRL